MTTTHTFQGLNTDGKPSSRVLNPPGGASSHIFGGSDAQPQQQQRNPAQTGSGSGNQRSSDVGGQGQSSTVGQKSRAQRNGEDSLYSVFGNYPTCDEASDKASDSSNVSSPIHGLPRPAGEQPMRNHAKSHNFNEDTFLNIFGDTGIERRKMFRSVVQNNADSFSRIFGESSPSESVIKGSKSSSSTLPVSSVQSELSTETSGMSSVTSGDTSSHSIISNPVSTEGSTASHVSSSQSLDQRMLATAEIGRRRRHVADRGAFNPITGEPYEQSKSTPEPQQTATNASVTLSSKAETGTSSTVETTESLSSNTISEEGKLQTADAEKSQNESQLVQQKAEPSAASAQQRKNQHSGIFGGAEEVKEQRSTRVSQPPGGRSTKLW